MKQYEKQYDNSLICKTKVNDILNSQAQSKKIDYIKDVVITMTEELEKRTHQHYITKYINCVVNYIS